MRTPPPRFIRRQRGFAILYVVLATVLLMGVVAAVTASSRTGISTSTDAARSYASALITQGNNLALSFESMETKNALLPGYITYGSCTASTCTATPIVAANDLLNPANSSLSVQSPPAKAFAATNTTKQFWIYKSAASGATPTVAGSGVVKVPGAGTTAADFTFVVTDLDMTVCQQINQQLFNSTVIPLAATAGATLVNFQGSATAPLFASAVGATDSTAVDMTATGSSITATWGSNTMQGCVQTSDATPFRYVYYVVAEPQ